MKSTNLTPLSNEAEVELQLVFKSTTKLATCQDFETLYSIVVKNIPLILPCQGLLLLLLDKDGQPRPEVKRGFSPELIRLLASRPIWMSGSGRVSTDLEKLNGLRNDPSALVDEALHIEPLERDGSLIGCLALTFESDLELSTTQQYVIQSISEHISVAIDRLRYEAKLRESLDELTQRTEKRLSLLKEEINRRKAIEEDLRKESARLKLLQQSAFLANEAESMEQVLKQVLRLIAEFLDWPLGHASIVQPEDEKLHSSGIWYVADDEMIPTLNQMVLYDEVAIGETWLASLLKQGNPLRSSAIGEKYTPVVRAIGDSIEVKAGVALPVFVDAKLAMILEFYSDMENMPWDDFLDLATHIGALVGRVIGRERNRNRLQKEEMLLSQAERIARLGSWEWDLGSATFSWSDELYRMLRLDDADIQPTLSNYLNRIHPDDRQRIAGGIETSIEQGRSTSFQHRILWKNGESRVVFGRCQPILDEKDQVVRLIGTIQDITNQIRLQKKLAHQSKQLLLLQQMGHAVTSTFDREKIFQEVLVNLKRLLSAQGVFVLLLEGAEFVFSASSETGDRDPTGKRLSAESGVAGIVLKTGEAASLIGDEARERTMSDITRALNYRPGSLLVAPLKLRDRVIGVLEATHRETDAFAGDDLEILNAAAAWTAIAVQNARLVSGLRASHDRLQFLARQIVIAQGEERKRISHELHDEAGQALTVLKINLEMMKSGLTSEQSQLIQKLDETIEITDQTMDQIRRLAHGLHPLVLDKFGLAQAAESLCNDFATSSDLKIVTEIESIPSLADQYALSLYRVLQEALTNIIKHANASEVTVKLRSLEDELQLAVSDDGQGFRASQLPIRSSTGIGLAGMQERVEMVGGRLEIASAPGNGTQIIARVPFAVKENGE